MYGIPCLSSYTNRQIGDVVQVLNLGANTWMVIGRIKGTDAAYLGPTTQNSRYQQYYQDTLTSSSVLEPGYEGYVGTNGAAGDRPVMLAWSYYNGTSNSLLTGTVSKTKVFVYIARSSTLHGKREAVEVQLCPHNYNTLPSTLTLATDSFSPVITRLEVGQVSSVQLPADWFSAITAGTPTIKGFAVQPVTTTPWEDSYAIFSATSGGFRAV
jgi:hypothetical protein